MIFNIFSNPHPNITSNGKELNHFPLGENKKGGKILKMIIVFILFFFTATDQGILSAQKNNVTFTDITKKAGITFKLNFGDNSYKNIIESSG